MADRFINWPPPKEAMIPLARALTRVIEERDWEAAKAARRERASSGLPKTDD